MAQGNRDEFTNKTKLDLAKRSGWLCSDPSCRRPTIGSNSDGDGEINLGIAAHICAAAPEGPRYDPKMTREERRSPDNGIWMCRLHAAAVDAKDSKFTVELLQEWKVQAQKNSWRRVLYDDALPAPAVPTAGAPDLMARIRAAAAADLEIFRRSEKWPSTAIALTLEVEGLSDPVSTSALATALATLDNLILVAPPGMGKTTTLFQIAQAALANYSASPIIVPLADWSTEGSTILDSILKRSAFQAISEDDLRKAAAQSGVILLLDGWNELDGSARQRAAAQVARLQMELPELSLLISTRKQALDVPLEGARVNLLPLDEGQQLDIARALRGEAGERIVDQAWRTLGVRELVAIPLYLTALLALPDGAPFPTTKEEILRRFVTVHEADHQRADALAEVTYGFQQRFLENLSAVATDAANTTIAEAAARRSIFDTDNALVTEGQITEKPQPNAILEALVSRHVLMRAGDPPGYSFQHQQFQEWYASHLVERLMIANTGDDRSTAALATVLNQPAWEEAILFACERLSRGDEQQQAMCAVATLEAFHVDPMLAAEMIHRATDAVWDRIGQTIQKLVEQWHAPGRVDRALRFMLTSGRPEFLDQVWPLITDTNDQVHLKALRAGRRFRPSILGSEAVPRLLALPTPIRLHVLHEIASNSGIDGMDLAATVAKADPDPDVKATVINAFSFRRADRHVVAVLRQADDRTFDLVARKGLVDHVTDEAVKAGLSAAVARLHKDGERLYDQLHALLYGPGDDDRSDALTQLVATMEIDSKRNGAVNLIYEAQKRYPQGIADAILSRVREGLTLPYHAAELMAGARFALEDDALRDLAFQTSRFDDRAAAAASVLGPGSVAWMMDKLIEAGDRVRDASGKYDQAAGERYQTIRDRVSQTPTASLLAAIAARSPNADSKEISELADLISRHASVDSERKPPLGEASLQAIASFVEDWGCRLLSAADATRAQIASVATLVGHVGAVALLPILKRLLDEDLKRWRVAKDRAVAEQYRGGAATHEARMSWTLQYRRAFLAIRDPQTAALMRGYLRDEDFGQDAALVLAGLWRVENEPSDEKHFRSGPDFSWVAEKRSARRTDPTASSAPADAIFDAVEGLITPGATEALKRHAVALGSVAAALPHGRRDETIKALIAIAERYSRAILLNNLALSGVVVDVELIKRGVADVFDAAQKQPWILTERHELKDWLRLLPFTDQPAEALDIVAGLPERFRTPEELDDMVKAFGQAPDDSSEDVLFRLAEADPRLYQNGVWQDAAFGRKTLSAAMRLVELAAQGVLKGQGHTDHWNMTTRLAGLIGEHAQVKAHVYALLTASPHSPGFSRLARAVAENPDVDGLLLLIQLEMEHKRAFASWRTVESVVTEQVPIEKWQGAYNILAVPVVELRRKLLAMTTDGGEADIAARYLTQIDWIRDEYGSPESEPRHPDLASGKPWPIMTSDADAAEAA